MAKLPWSSVRNFVFAKNGQTFDTEENREAAAKLQEWADNGYFTKDFNGVGYDPAWQQFAKGKGPFTIAGTWITFDANKALGDNKSTLADAQAKIASLQDEAQKIKEELQAELESAKKTLAETAEKLSASNAANEKLKADAAAEVAALKKATEELQAKHSDLAASSEGLKKDSSCKCHLRCWRAACVLKQGKLAHCAALYCFIQGLHTRIRCKQSLQARCKMYARSPAALRCTAPDLRWPPW